MELGRIIDILGAIVGVGLAFVLVSHQQTAQIITAFGNTFTNALRVSVSGK